LVSKEKTQTYRCLFIPNFSIGDKIAITFKQDKNTEFLFFAKITEIYPKRIIDVDLLEAMKDGFTSVEAFRKGIQDLNKIKDLHHWGFIIRFEPL
jgi:hypothetical protein